jgi:hypothetical protein
MTKAARMFGFQREALKPAIEGDSKMQNTH